MNYFDIILILIIVLFSVRGFWMGFINTLSSLLGTVLGIYLASRYYAPVADWLIGVLGWGDNGLRVVMFIIAFLLINRLVALLFWFIAKTFKFAASLLLLSTINRIFGAVFGILEGVVTVGIVIYFLDKYPLSPKLMEMIAASTVAPYTLNVVHVLLPLLPKALKTLKSSVDFVEGKLL